MGSGDRCSLFSGPCRLTRCFGLPFPQPLLHSILWPELQEKAVHFHFLSRELCSEGCFLFLDLSEFSVGFYGECVHCLVSDNAFKSLESRVSRFCYFDLEPDPFVSCNIPRGDHRLRG